MKTNMKKYEWGNLKIGDSILAGPMSSASVGVLVNKAKKKYGINLTRKYVGDRMYEIMRVYLSDKQPNGFTIIRSGSFYDLIVSYIKGLNLETFGQFIYSDGYFDLHKMKNTLPLALYEQMEKDEIDIAVQIEDVYIQVRFHHEEILLSRAY